MKGIVFNILEDVITREYGANTWDDLLATAQSDGVFTSLGNYPDAALLRIVGAASQALKLPPETIVRWFGQRMLPLLAQRYASFFTPHTATRPFLLTLNDVIHPEVRKLYPGADTPEFEFDTTSPEVLVMTYRSKRKLCALAEGLVEGAAEHFRETVTIAHPVCMTRGADCCRMELRFAPKGSL
jgi:hypothetical protein